MAPAPAHHLPQYHLRTPRGYVNDPNGPVELAGATHLYFQSRPRADRAVPVEWGHASSADLVRWTLHRPAMAPVPGGPDSDGCWSGNTLADGDEVVAFYSGKRAGDTYQSVLRAVSTDGGATFGAPRQVVADPADDEQVTMFRDPFVFRDGDALTLVVGSGGADGSAAIRRYRSRDGLAWEQSGDAARLARTTVEGEDTGDAWECPQIVPTDAGEVAVVSAWTFDGGIGHVLSFPLADGTPAPRRVDHGANFYAASVLREHSTGPVLWGWITEGRADAAWQEAGWAGAISLPRRVWSAPDGTLRTAPHPAVDALRTGDARSADGARIGARAEIVVPAASGAVRLDFGPDEYCTIELDPAAGTVAFDRTHASLDAGAHRDRAVAPDAFDDSGRAAVRVFLDGSVVEIFTSAGRSLTSRVYPLAAPEWTVRAPAGAVVHDLAAAIGTDAS